MTEMNSTNGADADFYSMIGRPLPQPTNPLEITLNKNDIDINRLNECLKEEYINVINPETLNKIKRLKKIMTRNNARGRTYYQGSPNLKCFGRKYCNESLQLVWAEVRNALVYDKWEDIDMKNAHPTILNQLCQKLGINCPKLNEYVNNRDKYLKDIMDNYGCNRRHAKNLFIMAVYGSSFNTWNTTELPKTQFLEEFYKERDNILNLFWNMNTFVRKNIIEKKNFKINLDGYDEEIKKTISTNPKASLLSLTLQIEEDYILNEAINFFSKLNYKIKMPSFDGLAIKKDDRLNNDVLDELKRWIKKMTDYEIDWDIKDMKENRLFKWDEVLEKQKETINKTEMLIKPEELDEYHLTKALLKLCPNYVWVEEKLYKYDGIIWKEDRSKESIELCKDISLKLKPFLKEKYETIKDNNLWEEQELKVLENFIKKIDNASFERNIVKQSKKIITNNDITFDKPKNLIAFLNGVLDTENLIFEEKPPQNFYLSQQINYNFKPELLEKEFINEDVKSEIMEFFTTITKDTPSRDHLIMSLASTLRRENKEQLFINLQGSGGNGKSVIREMMSCVFDNLSAKLSADYFTEKNKKTGGANADLLLLKNKYFVYVEELDESMPFQSERFKNITDGKISARNLYSKDVENFEIGRVFCFCNDPQKFTSIDQAIVRRSLYYHLDKNFVSNPKKINERKVDISLTERFKTEKYRDEFLLILIEYLRKYNETNLLEMPLTIKKDIDRYLNQADTVREFYNEYLEITENQADRVKVKDIYDTFKNYLIEIEDTEKRISLKKFTDKLKNLGALIERKAGNNFMYYTQIKYNEEKQ